MIDHVTNIVGRALGRRPHLPAGLRPVPRLDGGLPVLGHTVEFIRGTIDLLFRAQRRLGEAAAFDVFHRRMVALFGPEAHEAVFRAPDEELSPAEAYKIMTPIFGKDVVYDAPPEKMAEQLKMLLPALKDRRMRTYGEAVVHETEQTIGPWGEAGVVDFVEYCRVLTNFTSSRCLLGHEFREGMSEEFAAVYHDLERGLTPLAYVNAHLPLPSFRKRDRARVRLVEMISRIAGARRRESRTGEDFLQTLMDSRYSDGRELSEHEITGLLLAGMFAGHHTSSVTTAWTLIELLRNPDTLRRALAEIDSIFGDGQPVSHQALRGLVFVESAIKEALRLHPPLFMLVRVAKRDFVYKDYFIPQGTWIVVSPTVAHRIPSVFADPDRFDPDRFAPPREEDKRDFAFIAFGGGRHKCLGNAFAILQVKAILALLLGRYEFELAGDPVESDFHGLVVGPKEPCRVRYRQRVRPSVSAAAAEQLGAALADAKATTQAAAKVATQSPPRGCPMHAANADSTANIEPAATTASAPLQIVIDRDLCQGHATCVGEAPELFKIGEDGKVALRFAQVPPSLMATARQAEKYCPTRAIRLRG